MDARALAGILPEDALLTAPADLAAYSYDAAYDRGRPEAVVLPRAAEEVRRVVAWCAERGTPFVARGAGTNLSGGCVALQGGVVVSLARMSRILEIDAARGVALAEPGVVNLSLQKELEKSGLFYAPDPASFRVSTLGGNVAENSGGPRCLKYGVTTNHVLAVEAAMPDGTLARFSLEDEGPEILSLLVGAEGTLGVVTKAWLKALPLPERIETILAGFSSIDAAVECVAALIAAGLVPRVLEAMDRATVEAVEAYVHAGYPKSDAVLLIELDGSAEEVASGAVVVEKECRARGAVDYRAAKSEAEREKLWEGRRGAYAAMARSAPNVMVEDGVVPRNRLPDVVRRIKDILARHRLTGSLLFHAGDGNIHPNVGYDERDPDQVRRIKAAGREILQACVELGGSLSGEHGIGTDKRAAMAGLFTPDTLELFRRIKRALDPKDISNPDKIIPLASDARVSFKRPERPFSAAAAHLIEKVKETAAANRSMSIVGSGSRLRHASDGSVPLLTTALREITDLDKANFTVSVEAGISVHELHLQLKRQGIYLALPDCGGTLGGLLATRPWIGLREDLIGMRLLLADGGVADLGGKVVKNVAGYDVPRLILGSWGWYGVILEATFKAYARPRSVPADLPSMKPFRPSAWHRRLKAAFDPQNRLNPWLSEGDTA